MTSATQRIKQTKQPWGGYINPRSMEVIQREDVHPSPLDHKVESVHASLMGMSVDYLTRLAGGTAPDVAFQISLTGARLLGAQASSDAETLVAQLKAGHVDEFAIRTACKLAGYDVAFRAGPMMYNPAARTTPDAITSKHIGVMVERSLSFFAEYGPVTLDGFKFPGGYTEFVSSGDGDFLTADMLWDFKVSVSGPTKDHTLQLLMYWLMGRRSDHPEFQNITNLGVFNPRLNRVYRLSLADVPAEVVAEVSSEVIGY